MKLLLLVLLLIVSPTIALASGAKNISPATLIAHSGGTDKCGCHYNKKTGEYHCHKRKKRGGDCPA